MATSNIEKEKIIMNLFINKKNIRALMDGSHAQSVAVFEKVKQDVEKEGKQLFHHNKVPTARVVKALGIDEKQIHRNAELERQQKKDVS